MPWNLNIQQAITAAGNGWEIAGGIGENTPHPTWSAHTHMEWPAYSSNGPSSSNPPSSWSLNNFRQAQPGNSFSSGTNTTETVSSGLSISGGITKEGVNVGVSGTYQVTYSWTVPEFFLNPTSLTTTNSSWCFSDNQGQYTTPNAATIYNGVAVKALSPGWNHVWVKTTAQFVKFTSSWFGWIETPSYGKENAGFGFNVYAQ